MQQSETDRRRLLESTIAIPWEANAKTWQFTYVGPQVAKLLGYTCEQWKEKDFWTSHIHTEDREYTISFCKQSSRILDDYEFNYRMIAADGRVVWLHDIVNVVRVNDEPEILRGFMIDITESENMRITLNATFNELKKADDRLKNLSDNAPIGLCYFNRDLRFVHINQWLASMNGLTINEHIGYTVSELIPGLSVLPRSRQSSRRVKCQHADKGSW